MGDGGALEGVIVIVTRASEQSEALAAPLRALGAEVVLSPAIRLEEPPDWGPADRALREAPSYQWAIFTSANGVQAVERRLSHLGLDWSLFRGCRLAAIGPATAEAIRGRGLSVAVVPEIFQAEGILDALGLESVAGKRILIARALKAREILPDELRRRGADVDVVAVYRTASCAPAPAALEALAAARGGSDVVVTFTSASTVTSFIHSLPREHGGALRACLLAAIGPITAEELARLGLAVAIQPREFTIPALVEALKDRFASRPRRAQPSPERPV